MAVEMRKAGLTIPILIGGATTSKLYVALKVAPVYGGPVVWMQDASQNSLTAAKLLSEKERPAFVAELNQTYEALRAGYQQEQEQLLTLEEARRHKLNLFE